MSLAVAIDLLSKQRPPPIPRRPRMAGMPNIAAERARHPDCGHVFTGLAQGPGNPAPDAGLVHHSGVGRHETLAPDAADGSNGLSRPVLADGLRRPARFSHPADFLFTTTVSQAYLRPGCRRFLCDDFRGLQAGRAADRHARPDDRRPRRHPQCQRLRRMRNSAATWSPAVRRPPVSEPERTPAIPH
jgi:hypothetical protein